MAAARSACAPTQRAWPLAMASQLAMDGARVMRRTCGHSMIGASMMGARVARGLLVHALLL